jgi:hypothetical protein
VEPPLSDHCPYPCNTRTTVIPPVIVSALQCKFLPLFLTCNVASSLANVTLAPAWQLQLLLT